MGSTRGKNDKHREHRGHWNKTRSPVISAVEYLRFDFAQFKFASGGAAGVAGLN
jgi:hypothetical protein